MNFYNIKINWKYLLLLLLLLFYKETEYELRETIKDLNNQLKSQKLNYELELSELNKKFLEEHMNLERNINSLKIENVDLKKLVQDLDLEKQVKLPLK